jgi:AcrR family transcriptional regulator
MASNEPRRRLREQLIDAAERLIAEHGLGALRARDLAQAAGCAVGATYTVFADLDALVLTVNARTLSQLDAHLRAASARPLKAETQAALATARLVALATAYLDFAAANQPAWRALFEHRMADGRAVPEGYRDQQMRLFGHIEEPLRLLRPELDTAARAALSRSLFSAAHGIVTLGLEARLTAVPLAALRQQLTMVIGALGAGLARPAAKR